MSNGQPGITLSDSLSPARGNPELSSVSTATVNIELAPEIFNVRLVVTWTRKLSIILLIRKLSIILFSFSQGRERFEDTISQILPLVTTHEI